MKHLFAPFLVFIYTTGFGQSVQKIHKTDGNTLQQTIANIDSVSFSTPPATKLRLRNSDGSLQDVLVSEIDSITFLESEDEANWGKRMQIALAGQIFDEQGQPLSNVTVRAGSDEVVSDVNGAFYFHKASVRQHLGFVSCSRAGYFNGSRSFLPRAGVNTVKINMLQKNNAGAIAATAGGTVQAEGVNITFPANGFVKNGAAYNGNVQVSVNYIDPESKDFDTEMPGNLLGMIGGMSRGLISYGMVAVELSDNTGDKVELASGKTAEIRFPLSDSLQSNAPAEIDLWYFDEESGLWQHEGTATRQGNAYLANVSHFSFWNCDIPFPFVELKGKITDPEGNPVSGAKVTLYSPTIGSATDYTSSSGDFGGFVPLGEILTMKISLSCDTTGLYEVVYSQEIGPFSQATSMSPISATSQDVALIHGSIRGCQNSAVNSGYVIASGNVYFADTSGGFSFITCRNGNLTMQAFTSYPRVMGAPKSIELSGSITDAGEFLLCPDSSVIVIDIDGNQYATVKIGTQVWMAENLKTSKFADGSVIPNVTANAAWTQLSTPAWCSYDNNSSNDSIYGKLYNWVTVADSRNVCPTGWHVPADAEWTTLIDFLGGDSIAGGKMKSVTGWNAPNTGASNESNFSALPGGFRFDFSGVCAAIGDYGSWWSSTESSAINACYRSVSRNSPNVVRICSINKYGRSVRCLRD
jgi:uncharacterized protein (TIGR02145 family)